MRAPGASHPRRAGERGLTLLELLLVVAIVSVVLGAGLGLFAALDVEERQASGLVRATLRRARDVALASRAPAQVLVDPGAGTLRVEGLRAMGTWHFEDDLEGSFEHAGRSFGAQFADGFLGRAIAFPERAHAEIPVQLDPGFDPRLGFALECAVLWEERGGGRIVSLGTVSSLELGGAGELRGRFAPEIERDGEPARGHDVVLQAPAGSVPSGRWCVLRFAYDRARLVLAVDGVVVAEEAAEARVARLDGPLAISDESHSFPGRVDRLVVSVVVADEDVELPGRVRIERAGPGGEGRSDGIAPEEARAPFRVRFGAGGELDRGAHPAELALRLVHEERGAELVRVGRWGSVR